MNFRLPTLDVVDVLKTTRKLTRSEKEVEKAFLLAAFNVFLSNRDDHAKNVSFLMNSEGEWELSPAYDLTYSQGPGGEHSTTVVGEGRTPGPEHLLQLAKVCDVRPKFAKFALEAIAEARVWIRSELAAAGYKPRS